MTISNLLKFFKLADLWRYKIKSIETTLNSILYGFLTYLIVHIFSCIFIFIGKINHFGKNTWIH